MPVGRLPDPADEPLLRAAVAAVNWDRPGRIGVAVSGGSDSMALLHLMQEVAPLRGWVVHAVTVDHRLRPESAGEAAAVGQVCAGLGVSHDVLVWDHADITGNLSDQARRARYRLIAEWAATRGIGHVVVAHTLEDQAETFLMELARKAGVDGLSGMRGGWNAGEVFFSRPLLGVSRTDLRAYLTPRGVAWIDDPTNENDAYTRVKARRVLAALKPLGITAGHLGAVAEHLDLAREALIFATAKAADSVVTTVAGAVHLDREVFWRLPFEIQRRLLMAGLLWVNRADYAPRGSALERVQGALIQERDVTLAGCRIRAGEGQVAIVREPKAVAGAVTPTDQLWDSRWRVDGPHEAGLQVRALGAAGLKVCKDWRSLGISRDALLVSPGIWRGDALIAAPVAGFSNGWTADIPASFSRFIVSH
ncbi:MAG: tRNA lysidine(34) synthetase TilS [Paracoccaceae bacterium]